MFISMTLKTKALTFSDFNSIYEALVSALLSAYGFADLVWSYYFDLSISTN